jgi:hypothetical protein
MESLSIVQSINEFNNACDDAVGVYCHGKELQGIVSEAPEGEINATTMNVLNQAIEGLVDRSGVFYGTLAMEAAGSRAELKQISVEGLGNFISEVWEKIKKAFFALIAKIKEFFTGNERKAAAIKESLDKAKEESKDIQKEAVKKDVEGKELEVMIENPSPFILHKSYFRNGNKEVTVKFHDLVENLANYCMKSREHHLMEYVRDFKEDVMGLLDSVDPNAANPSVANQIYAILNNYVSEKKLTGDQASNLRRFKALETVEEFDSDYGNKRYVMKFGITKDGESSGAEQLITEQAIAKAYRANEIVKLTVTGVEVMDMKHLMNALTDNYTELTNYIKISREINSLNIAVVDMIRDIDSNAGGNLDTGHVVTLSLINKGINAVSKLFTVIQTDVMTVMKEHTDLYMLFNQKFETELL